jgi:hypothetical protein
MATVNHNEETGRFEIVLSADDPAAGKFKASGAIEKWPDVDCFNQPYERNGITIRRGAGVMFIVVPHGKDGQVDISGPSINVSASKAAKD